MKHIGWKGIRDAYSAFMEGKGFGVVVTVCIAVITASAVWTVHRGTPDASTSPPVHDGQEAAVQLQQSLRDAATPTPLPNVSVPLWHSPLSELSVVTPFSGETPILYESGGYWRVHDGVDLLADTGTPVYSMADGKVITCGEDFLLGAFIQIAHADGYESRYAGLSLLSAMQTGDLVRAGQTLGFVGNGMPSEAAIGPHLHLQLLQHGTAVDPLPLIQ